VKLNLSEVMNHFFDYLIDQNLFQGSVLVRKGDHFLFRKQYGMANLSAGQRIEEGTVFELASVSKPFTSLAIMILQEKGMLSYEDSLSRYVPELPYPGVTVRNLLNHTSGLPDYTELFHKYWDRSKTAANSDVVQLLSHYRPAPLFLPGENWAYSNTGYVLLALIIEQVSGLTFHEFLDRYIFQKLGMSNTFVAASTPEKRINNQAALGYIRVAEDRLVPSDELEETDYVTYLGGIYGDGMIRSTPWDLHLWDQALSQYSLVAKKTWDEAVLPTMLPDGTRIDYGFGWQLHADEELGSIVSHGGSWPGFSTSMIRYADRDATIIYLSNAPQEVEIEQQVILAMENILFGKAYEKPVKKEMPNYISVAPELLKHYEGIYRLEDGTKVSICREGLQMYLQVEGQNRFLLRAVAENEFLIKDVNGKIRFLRSEQGDVRELIIDQGAEYRAAREM